MADVKEASRGLEFTNPKMHAGWRRGTPVFVVFSLNDAKALFEEFNQVIAICVAPPHAVMAKSYEQCVHFFSSEGPRAFVEASVYGI